MLSSFYILIYYLHIFLDEVSVYILWLHFNWVVFLLLSFKNDLPILDTSLLTDTCFANIFSQSEACLFILLTVSFTDQKFLLLMKFVLFDFFFHGLVFFHVLVLYQNSGKPKVTFPMLSSRSFEFYI